jgi:hypothetical protein
MSAPPGSTYKDMIKIAIRSPRDKPQIRKTEVLEFRTFYGVLREMARLLRRRGVTHWVYTEPWACPAAPALTCFSARLRACPSRCSPSHSVRSP